MKYINDKMSEEELIINLSGNIKSSYELLEALTILDKFYMIAREFDYYDIIGDRIYKLYHYCCNDNIYDLDETMMLFRFGAFSKEEIIDNLESENPIPFLNKDVMYYKDENHNMNDYIKELRDLYIFNKEKDNSSLLLIKDMNN